MKKQALSMILWRTIPYIRNIQSNGFRARIRNLSCRYESELIYKIPSLILFNSFSNSDIDFLNTQAKYYYENSNNRISAEYLSNLELIKELFLLVPLEKKMMLKWEGPVIKSNVLKKQWLLEWELPINATEYVDIVRMNCSTKQEIYISMFNTILLHIRNIQQLGLLRRGMDLSCYYNSELIHNLIHSIHQEKFVEHDIIFLNYQTRWYIQNCNSKISSIYLQNLEYIRQLFSLVPDEMKPDLIWDGP